MDFENENDNPPDLVGVSDQGPEGSNPSSAQPGDLSIAKVPITIVTGQLDTLCALCPALVAKSLRLPRSREDNVGQLHPA